MERGIRDQIFAGSGIKIFYHFWDRGSKFWVKISDQLRRNIPRYDPDKARNFFATRCGQGLRENLSSNFVEFNEELRDCHTLFFTV